MRDFLTTRESAKILGISDARVRQLIYAGRLPSEKIGQMNLIKKEDLELVRERKVGRPAKVKSEKT
jgi:excisionase family DNA binding protein